MIRMYTMSTWSTETEGLYGPVSNKGKAALFPGSDARGRVLGEALVGRLSKVSQVELETVIMPVLRAQRPDVFDDDPASLAEAIRCASFQGFIYESEEKGGFDVINNSGLREKLSWANRQD